MADPALLGAYVSGGAGPNFAGTLSSSQGGTSIGTSVGPLGVGAVGLKWAYGFRTEVEGRYNANSFAAIDTLRVNGAFVPLTNSNGNASTSAVVGNLFYDIPLHPFGLPIQPYIGAGLGYARLDFANAGGGALIIFHLPQNNTVTAPGIATFGAAGALAYQVVAGLSTPLGFLPGWDATLEYRFFGTAHENVTVSRFSSAGLIVNGARVADSFTQSFSEHSSEILIGLRYSFFTPTM